MDYFLNKSCTKWHFIILEVIIIKVKYNYKVKYDYKVNILKIILLQCKILVKYIFYV